MSEKITEGLDRLLCSKSIYAEQHVVVLEFSGANSPAALKGFKSILDSEFDSGNYRLILDLGRMNFVDSPTLASIYYGCKEARKNMGDIRICHLLGAVKIAFETMRLDHLFKIYSDEEEAVISFCEDPPNGLNPEV